MRTGRALYLSLAWLIAAGCTNQSESHDGSPGDANVSNDNGPSNHSDSAVLDGGTDTVTVPLEAGTVLEGGSVPGDSGLPNLPTLERVQALVQGNSATISFEPMAGAKDYRVYVMPQSSDIRLNADGSLAGINNAVYRCAGRRSTAGVFVDGNGGPDSDRVPNWLSVTTRVDHQDVEGYNRTLADATMGHAFRDSTADTVPVYAVGDPQAGGDNYGYGMREPQTRSKLYVLDNRTYLAQGWRDDGIAFYAPSSAHSSACGNNTAVQVLTKDTTGPYATDHLYYVAGTPEASQRGTGSAAFFLCPNSTATSEPVMRVYYQLNSPGGAFGGTAGHDEIVLGQQRFDRARCQGSTFGACADANQSSWQVQWSNITAPTQLVVEALDAGCPFGGLMGPRSLAPTLNPLESTAPITERVFTFAELQAAAPHEELFLNGQFDGTTPHPIARSIVNVAPQTRPTMDWESDFAGHPETFTELLNADGSPNCGLTPALVALAASPDCCCDGAHRLNSATYDVLMMDQLVFGLGTIQGELWSVHSDGELRFTPRNTTATFSNSSFLHVAMEASSYSSNRRYPQILISQQDFITGEYLLRASTGPNPNVQPFLIMQPFDTGPGRKVVEIELCSGRQWEVNNQCPWFLLEKLDPPSSGHVGANNPHPEVFDRLQDDLSARFDLFVSTDRAYVYFDNQPYGCADFSHRTNTDPSGATISPTPAPPPPGPVTVAFGDVFYHPAAEIGDQNVTSPFHYDHMQMISARHFDYVGFRSQTPAPAWDETRFPCVRQMHQGGNAGPQIPESD